MNFVLSMTAFILGDLCRYPAVGWGKTACFPVKASKISYLSGL